VGDAVSTVLASKKKFEYDFTDYTSICVDSRGNIITCNFPDSFVDVISPDGTIKRYGAQTEIGNVNGEREQVRFNKVISVMCDAHDDIYCCDFENGLIRKISGEDGLVSTVQTNEPLSSPVGVAIRKGDIFLIEMVSPCIKKIDHDGNVTVFAGDPDIGGNRDGPANNARFQSLVGITYCAHALFVADDQNQNIRMITPDGRVTTVAGSPQDPLDSHIRDGYGYEAKLRSPECICINSKGTLFMTCLPDVHAIRQLKKVRWHPSIARKFPPRVRQEIKALMTLSHCTESLISYLPKEIQIMLAEYVAS